MRQIRWGLFLGVLLLSACGDSEDAKVTDKQQDNSSQITQDTSDSKPEKLPAITISSEGEFQVLNISEGIYDNTAALQINVNKPLQRQQDFNQLIQVSVAGQAIQPAWIVGEQALALYYPFIETSTEYNIQVSQSLQSEQGDTLTQNHQKTFTTQAAQQSVRFISQGYTLLPTDQALPIEAVNVNAVDLKFWRIKKNHLHQFLQQPNKSSIYQLQDLSEMADLAYSAQFQLDSSANKTEQHRLPISGIKGIQPAGVYFVTMLGAENYDYDYASTWFIQTDIALHSRQYSQSLAVFAQQLPSAEPYQQVKLTTYNDKGTVQAEAVTDSSGYALLTSNQQHDSRFILAEKGDHIQILRLNEPKLDLTEFPISGRNYQTRELFLYAPRDLYRPGETVHINGLLRNDDGRFETALPVSVDVKRPDNRVVRHFNWAGDGDGFYSTSFDLPDSAMTGQWQFVVHLSDKRRFQYEFSVQDFLPERLAMTLQPKNTVVNAIDSAEIAIKADYLYGAPAAGNRFDATVTMSSAQKLFDDYSDYKFGSNHYQEFNDTFTVDAAQLNDAGTGMLNIPNKWRDTQFPLNLTAHVNVYEAGGRPLSRYSRLQVWPHDRAVGIKPLWDSRFADPNSSNGFSLIAVNQAGERIDMADAHVVLVQENSERYWHWGDDGWAYRNQEKEQTVYSAIQPMTAAQAVNINLPVQYGQYRLEVRNGEQNVLSSYRFFAGWRWYDPSNIQAEKPDQVKLNWQEHAVTPGATARLSVQAPFAGAAIITVESDELLWHKVQQLDQAQTEVHIPIDKNWQRHDIYASVTVIKAGQPKRKHLPQRALGLIHVPLDRQARHLNISLNHDDKVLPKETLTVQIKVSADGQTPASESYVTLAAVDTGVLNVSQFKSPDPFAWFFDPRGYAPAIYDMYGRLIALIDAKNAVQKFGGDADITRGGDKPKSEVQIVSLLSDKVALNDQGEAQVSFELPYFNGELRLMAVAFNKSQMGSADSTIKVAAPVVIEASLPRFMAKGDQSSAVIEVHNTEQHPVKLQLKIAADQALGGQVLEQEISLNADEKHRIQLPIFGENHNGQGHLRVQAQADDFSMDRQWTLGLRPARPAITQQHSFVINPGEKISSQADWYNHFESDGLKSILTLSDTIILAEEQQLAELLQYPYGCLEQTTSRAWPLILADQKDFEVYAKSSNTDLYQKRHQYLETAIGRILSMQKSNGGFGSWSSDSSEAPWLTVFASDFLITAKNQGYSVPDKALQKATERLRHYVQSQFHLQSDFSRYLSNQHSFRVSVKAYTAYVLAQTQQVNVADVRRVYDSLTTAVNSPLPLAHLARALELLGDQKRATEAWQQVVDFKWQADRYAYYGNYGSKIRDYTAVVGLGMESTLLQQLPQSVMPLLPEIKAELQQRRWLSTQERGVLFRTAKMLGQQSGGDWRINLSNQGQSTDIERDQDLINVYVEQDAKTKINIENTGNKTVFADWTYQGYPSKPVTLKDGVNVSKHYYDLAGKPLNLSQVTTGDMVLVKITASLDKQYNYLPDALLVDLLPAGFEPENQQLDHAMSLDDIKIDGKSATEWIGSNRLQHEEYRDDRYVAAFTLSAYEPTHLIYLVRAVTPGTYIVPQALVEDMYRPELRGLSDTDAKLTVHPR